MTDPKPFLNPHETCIYPDSAARMNIYTDRKQYESLHSVLPTHGSITIVVNCLMEALYRAMARDKITFLDGGKLKNFIANAELVMPGEEVVTVKPSKKKK